MRSFLILSLFLSRIHSISLASWLLPHVSDFLPDQPNINLHQNIPHKQNPEPDVKVERPDSRQNLFRPRQRPTQYHHRASAEQQTVAKTDPAAQIQKAVRIVPKWIVSQYRHNRQRADQFNRCRQQRTGHKDRRQAGPLLLHPRIEHQIQRHHAQTVRRRHCKRWNRVGQRPAQARQIAEQRPKNFHYVPDQRKTPEVQKQIAPKLRVTPIVASRRGDHLNGLFHKDIISFLRQLW